MVQKVHINSKVVKTFKNIRSFKGFYKIILDYKTKIEREEENQKLKSHQYEIKTRNTI